MEAEFTKEEKSDFQALAISAGIVICGVIFLASMGAFDKAREVPVTDCNVKIREAIEQLK